MRFLHNQRPPPSHPPVSFCIAHHFSARAIQEEDTLRANISMATMEYRNDDRHYGVGRPLLTGTRIWTREDVRTCRPSMGRASETRNYTSNRTAAPRKESDPCRQRGLRAQPGMGWRWSRAFSPYPKSDRESGHGTQGAPRLALVSGEKPFDRTGTDVTVRARTARGAVEKTPRADTDAMHGAPESAQKPSQKHGVVPHNAKTTKPCSNPKRETEESYTSPDRFLSSDIWFVSRSNFCRRTGLLQE